VRTENWCKPHGYGNIDPGNFTPLTKNPNIAKFFREIGRFEELGSGVRNIFKYTKFYSNGRQPELLEGDIFKVNIPLDEMQHYEIDGAINGAINGAIDGASIKVKEKLKVLLKSIASNEGKRAPDYNQVLKVSDRSLERYLSQLKEAELIEFRGEAAQTGEYYLTEKMKAKLK